MNTASKSLIIPGPYVIDARVTGVVSVRNADKVTLVKCTVGSYRQSSGNMYEVKHNVATAHAELVKEALSVFQTTGMTPYELLKLVPKNLYGNCK